LPGAQAAADVTGLRLAERLIAKGADVNAKQTKPVDDAYRQGPRIGATPFWLAAKYVDSELMRVLLKNGADPELTTVNHTTPLMAATGLDMMYLSEDTGSDEETLDAVRLCLDRGDVNAANDNGDTALHGASRRGINAVVQLLVERGAKLDAKNKKGLSPLAVASGAQRGDVQPQTAALLKELMTARGLTIDNLDPEATLDPLKRPARVIQ
jgi:ankyrin repeat protein